MLRAVHIAFKMEDQKAPMKIWVSQQTQLSSHDC